MSTDKKLLYELAEQEHSVEELQLLTSSTVEKWMRAKDVKVGKRVVPNEVVYLSYYNWCSENNEPPETYAYFFRALHKIIPGKNARRKLDTASFDMSPEFFFKARQKLLTLLPKQHTKLPGRLRPKGIYGKKKESKNKKNTE